MVYGVLIVLEAYDHLSPLSSDNQPTLVGLFFVSFLEMYPLSNLFSTVARGNKPMQNISCESDSPWYIPFFIWISLIVTVDVSVVRFRCIFHKLIVFYINSINTGEIRLSFAFLCHFVTYQCYAEIFLRLLLLG